ncbi:hypothetical protein [Poseidonibacter ostreae]|jgi:hypothetical protein|uniref:Lipoprotein n=1 Tax=Poseidonibacter ostreae TaxID=2654171 RepID=A0A6L4WQJ1_9BACT|nr:hypothetical protein [Poseidonibacter ostreae]KAB7884725.1 hypothetical protein GA417_10615 [Poseidonibacter ostreae]KAB7887042.1 hypothetical protein GBG19_11310 [Poseidonibacter ostreae]KAB7892013.1 hypothetical protein GBG18_04465 [Poseidonibacter ostreae]
MLKSLKHSYKLLLGIISILLLSGCVPYYSSYGTPYYYQNTYYPSPLYYARPMRYHTPVPYHSDVFIPYYP